MNYTCPTFCMVKVTLEAGITAGGNSPSVLLASLLQYM